MHVQRCFWRIFAAVVFTVASGSAFAIYTSINVFGDSLSDNGNALGYNLASPGLGVALGYLVPTNPGAPPYPAAATKYTNPGGHVAVEVLSGGLGLPLAPSSLGGTNFATGGAGTGTSNFAGDGAFVPNPSPIPGVPPGTPFYPGLSGIGVGSQVAQFVSALGGSGADSTGLYVVWAGPNDVFLNQVLGQPQDPTLSVTNLAAAVTNLYNAGARTILLPNMPDLGRTPAFLGGPDAAGATGFTLAFNAFLAAAIPNLEGTLTGLDILAFDTFGTFNALLADPGAFGFSNVVTPCYLIGAACDPAQFVFWDFVHPTSAVHQILGQGFLAAALPQSVGEPASLALFCLAFGALGLSRRRKKSR